MNRQVPITSRLFLIFWSAVVIILIGLMAMLYVSLIPHFGEIGNVAFIVLCIFLAYGVIIGGFGTWHLIFTWNRDRRVIQRGEVVAYLDANNSFVHLSAQHEAAKIPRLSPAPKDEAFPPDERDIIQMYNDGQVTLETIADTLGLKYHRVQAIIAQAKKAGLIHRK
jgi:Sigma-70, region 4